MEILQRIRTWLRRHPVLHRWALPLVLLAICGVFFAYAKDTARMPVGILIVIPVMIAAWLEGKWAWGVYLLGLVMQAVIALLDGLNPYTILINQGGLLSAAIVLLVMVVVLKLRQASHALTQKTSEQQELLGELHAQAAFLTLLGDIVGAALEAVDMTSILQVLVNRTGALFGSDDCYITFWDEENRQTLPQVAYGSLREKYQQVHQFQQEEYTLTAAVMDSGRAIAIENVKETTVLSRNVAEEFPNLAALGLPLLAGEQKLGALILGFNQPRAFTTDEIGRGELAARQISLAVTKAILLEEEQKRTRQLDTLLALATECTEANSEEELIERATRLIGEKLYPENFGIMLLDDAAGLLRVHPSYQSPEVESPDIPIGKGITGRVARSGLACRVGDVRQAADYLSVDERVESELCVPLKLGERVIGVVNVESSKMNAYTADDENLLTIMAGQLATAMDRLQGADRSYRQATQLARANSLISILAQVGTRAAAAADPDKVLETMGTELSKLGLVCMVLLVTPDGEELGIRFTSLPTRTIRLAERLAHTSLQEFRITLTEANGLISTPQEPMLLANPVQVGAGLLKGLSARFIERVLNPSGSPAGIPVCLLPLRTEGTLLGHLLMWGEGLREGDLPTMSVFANQIASALQNASLLVKVQRLAVTDELTSLFNRRKFFEIAAAEYERAIENKQPLSIMIIDMDDFKHFNDQFGHLVGDQVLRGAARLMQYSVRARDVIGRYGGEEFSIALPGAEEADAVRVARRFLAQVVNSPIPTDAGELHVHISMGIASLTADVQSLNDLINRADQAMYQAKAMGGDQFMVHH